MLHPTPPAPSTSRLVASGLVSLAATLLAVELVLRVFLVAPRLIAPSYPLGAGIAGSELRLAQSEYDIKLRYNAFGFRGPEFPLEKDPGELRVLVLGDSFAEGIGVAERDRFADLLEAGLAARASRPVRVLDAGQMGTGPTGYVRNLLEFGVALQPDLVVMAVYVGNDFGVGVAPEAGLVVRETVPERAVADPGTWSSVLALAYVRRGVEQLLTGEQLLFRRPARSSPWEVGYGRAVSRQFFLDGAGVLGVTPDEFDAATAQMDPALLAEFFAGRINPSILIVAVAQKVGERKGTPPAKPREVGGSVAPVVRSIVRVRRTLEERGIGLLVLVVPDVRELERARHDAFLARLATQPSPEMERTGEVRRRFVAELAARGVPYLDLAPALQRAGRPVFHVMDGHFNEAGHRVAADALLERLADSF